MDKKEKIFFLIVLFIAFFTSALRDPMRAMIGSVTLRREAPPLEGVAESAWLRSRVALLEERLREMSELFWSEEARALAIESSAAVSAREMRPEFRRFAEERVSALSRLLPARVIFRDAASFSHVLWIDLGKKSNRELGAEVIALDAPVLSAGAIVGVIDRVEEKMSRVRLITDPSLSVSVRVARGDLAEEGLFEAMRLFEARAALSPSPFWRELSRFLEEQRAKAPASPQAAFFAKGELVGLGMPLWRNRDPILRGIGFNYDFDDALGSALELRLGRPLDRFFESEGVAMIEAGDLLVTTGLDGLFPRGLLAGHVLKVDPLEDGSCYYNVEVLAACGHLGELSLVEVMARESQDSFSAAEPLGLIPPERGAFGQGAS